MVKKIFVICFIWLLSLPVFSQGLISYVTVNPNEAYIGQPIQLKASVYTTTWFTSGVDIGNIQVDGALTVYFRSVSNTKMFGGKKYAGVDFYYNLFPTDEGVIQIPSLEIQIETPKEGDYIGIKHKVTTKTKSITVKGVPLGYNPSNWLVASSLNISEKWSVPLKDIKVGDVIQRTISRSAGGTLSEFIPATQWDTINGGSIYPKRPQVKTNKSKTGVSSQRVETVNYLFEKEGVITLPAIEYVYWNSVNKKFYKKQIDAKTIQVKPNADLAMLASIKKSLQKENEVELVEEDKVFLIFGLTVKDFLKYFVATLFALYFIYRILKWIIQFYHKSHQRYLLSESYAFKQVLRALHKNDFIEFTKKGNTWLSKINGSNYTIQFFINQFGTKKLSDTILKMNEHNFKLNTSIDTSNFKLVSEELKVSRKNYLDQKNSKSENKEWLNPIVNNE